MWPIEEYKIGIHDFSKGLISMKIGIILAPSNLLIIFFDLKLLFSKLFANENNRDILFFGFPM
jgi:hypothetical protein